MVEAAAVLAAFEDGSLPLAAWDHRQHLRAAYACLAGDDAFARFRAALLAYNARHGFVQTDTGGYHETMTRSFLRVMARCVQELPTGLAPTAVQACVVGMCADKRMLLRHYQRETIMGLPARRGWVEPDLVPLEAPPDRTIRPYTVADRAAVIACVAALQEHLRSSAPWLLPGDAMAAVYLEHLVTTCAAREGALYVAVQGGEVVGLACVWIERDFEALESALTQVAYVSDLVVLPAARGGGLGHMLLATCEEHALLAGVAHVQLTVLAGNPRAHALYAREGYEDMRLLLRKELGRA